MTAKQVYQVVEQGAGYELRRYPAHVVAEVEVRGDFESAGNQAFRPLASYIGGGNEQGRSIAMTAPVLQQSEADASVVAFVLPASETAGTAPAPKDARVRVREVSDELAAAVRFSGRWTRGSVEERSAGLRAAVVAAGYEPAGPVRFARYDPPWTPWFLRHNEVILPVRPGDAST